MIILSKWYMYSLFEMIYDCLFERSDSVLNPFEMLYDCLIEMIFRKQTVLLHACGVFRVLVDWILTKFNRQEPGWKIVCWSFRDDLWLSFRNDQHSSVFFSIWYMTVVSKWPRKIFVHKTIFVNSRKPNPRDENPLKISIFVQRFFRSSCPYAAWK